ncbi:MAG TPA: FadR/GntR family transcriptional regulator [Xanthobacteraceae bacterium]|nr:FadR/GntR family transcriptional regulator [Xanthobacteraceae bacterium]
MSETVEFAWPPATGGVRRLHSSIADDIGVAIVTGGYRPGDLLANEIAFSERLNVSRTAYREAVRILAAKGLVSSRPKAGTRVNARGSWHFLDPDVLRWLFETGSPDPAFVDDLFELRQIIEPPAAALTAVRRTPEQVDQLARALDDMARHTLSTEEGQSADRIFHETILRATGNEALSTLADGIAAAVRWTTYLKSRGSRPPRDPLPDHRAVLDAIAARNPERARTAMSELVGLALSDIQGLARG